MCPGKSRGIARILRTHKILLENGHMNAWELKHRQKLVEWQEKVAACRSSGLQVRAWCSQEGISVQTYYRWEREIVGRVGTKAAQESRELSIEAGYAVEKGVPPTFVEVPARQRHVLKWKTAGCKP